MALSGAEFRRSCQEAGAGVAWEAAWRGSRRAKKREPAGWTTRLPSMTKWPGNADPPPALPRWRRVRSSGAPGGIAGHGGSPGHEPYSGEHRDVAGAEDGAGQVKRNDIGQNLEARPGGQSHVLVKVAVGHIHGGRQPGPFECDPGDGHPAIDGDDDGIERYAGAERGRSHQRPSGASIYDTPSGDRATVRDDGQV